MCYVVLLNCLCWLILRNGGNSINLSKAGHLGALIDDVAVFMACKIKIDIDFIRHGTMVLSSALLWRMELRSAWTTGSFAAVN